MSKICRVCFDEGDDLDSLGLGSDSSGYKLAACVPEIDVYIVCNPAICKTCLPMLKVAYTLRETCIENERRFNTNFDPKDFVVTKKSGIQNLVSLQKETSVIGLIADEEQLNDSASKVQEVSAAVAESHVDDQAERRSDDTPMECTDELYQDGSISFIFNDCFTESVVNVTDVKENTDKFYDLNPLSRNEQEELNEITSKIDITDNKISFGTLNITEKINNKITSKMDITDDVINFEPLNIPENINNQITSRIDITDDKINLGTLNIPEKINNQITSRIDLTDDNINFETPNIPEKINNQITSRIDITDDKIDLETMNIPEKINNQITSKMDITDDEINLGTLNIPEKVNNQITSRIDITDDINFGTPNILYQTNEKDPAASSDGIYVCSICNKRYSSATNLNTHVMIIHRQFKKKYTKYGCLKCQRIFPSVKSIKTHFRTCYNMIQRKETRKTKTRPSKKLDAELEKQANDMCTSITEVEGQKPLQLSKTVTAENRPSLDFSEESNGFEIDLDVLNLFSDAGEGKSPTPEELQPTTEKSPLVIDRLKLIKCTVCSEYFINRMSLDAHLHMHSTLDVQNALTNKEEKVSCTICKELHDENYMEIHMKIHNTEGTYDCSHCEETFTDTCELETHTLIHLRNLCEVCGKTFDSKNDLLEHEKTHMTKCCDTDFPTGCLLQLHTYQAHGKACGICKETYSSFNGIFLHLLTHTGEDKVRCQHCNIAFKSERLLKTHLCKVYACYKCGQVCSSKDKLQIHERTHEEATGDILDTTVEYHTAAINKNFECNDCNTRFDSAAKILAHRCKLYQCKSCQVICNSNYEYKQHLICHISGSAEQRRPGNVIESCQLCFNTFKTPLLLKRHLLEEHCTKQVNICLVDIQRDCSILSQHYPSIICNLDAEPAVESTDCDPDDLWVGAYIKSERQKDNVSITCYACNNNFQSVDLYLEHMRQSHSTCVICKVKLVNVRTIVSHVHRHYRRNLSCDICSFSFTDFKAYVEHNLLHRTSELPTLKKVHKEPARIIGDVKLNDDHKQRLTKKRCETQLAVSIVKVYCELCHKEYINEEQFSKHISRVHGAFNNKCNVCQMNFGSAQELCTHELTHVDKRGVRSLVFIKGLGNTEKQKEHNVCDTCNKSFVYSFNLHRHKLFYHSSTDIAPFKNVWNPTPMRVRRIPKKKKVWKKCRWCGKKFRKASLARHLIDQHGRCTIESVTRNDDEQMHKEEITVGAGGRDVIRCEICKEEFESRECLHVHIQKKHF